MDGSQATSLDFFGGGMMTTTLKNTIDIMGRYFFSMYRVHAVISYH